MNPLRTLRDWWHRPVLDALARIEQNGRRAELKMAPATVHLAPGTSISDVADQVQRAMSCGAKGPHYENAAGQGYTRWCALPKRHDGPHADKDREIEGEGAWVR